MDNVKFILITLVVLGHCLERFTLQGKTGGLYNTIYTFHMPLFIFITGYFTNTKKNKLQYYDGILSLFSTYLFFQIVWCIINRTFSKSSFLIPQWTLWYLLCTTYWKCLIYPLRRANHLLLFGSSLLLSILGGFITFNYFSIPRFFAFSPFFVLGYILRENNFDFEKLRSKYLFVFSLLLFVIFVYLLQTDLSWLLYGKKSYYSYDCSVYFAPLLRLCSLVCACFFSAFILAYAPKSTRTSKYGENTLFYYLYHSFVICFLLRIMTYYHIPRNLLSFSVCTAIVVVSLLFAERIALLRFLTEPYKNIKRMCKK